MSRVTKGIIGTLAALVVFAGGYFARDQFDTHHFLYICPGTHRDSNCVNGQEFEIFDANGAPIYSVGEAGTPRLSSPTPPRPRTDRKAALPPPYGYLPRLSSAA